MHRVGQTFQKRQPSILSVFWGQESSFGGVYRALPASPAPLGEHPAPRSDGFHLVISTKGISKGLKRSASDKRYTVLGKLGLYW